MAWPLSQDYNEALQNPAQSFADPELRQGEAETNSLGLPAPRSGNFADVYAVVSGQRKWAVKCFTRQIPGLQERYQQISLHLQKVKLPFMVDFTFQERGIRIRSDWYPILKMHWVEGLTLNQFVKNNLDKPHMLETLGQLWVKLARRLRKANIAHCDLQHGNVLLVPASRAGALQIKLVDYDGMCVPSLTLLKSIELGHPAYQHPQRQREGVYNLEIDRFSHLVIYTALRALMVGGKALWTKHDDGDNLLFKPPDYQAPTKSRLCYEILNSSSEEGRQLVQVLMKALSGPLDHVPLLEELVHPSAETLHAFGLGKLEDAVAQEVIAHLANCPVCGRVVAAQSGDDFLLRLRDAQRPGTTPMPVQLAGRLPPEPTTALPGAVPARGSLPPELATNEQYEILRELGRGGMGMVYLARNRLLQRQEVLKVLNQDLLARAGGKERFLREIQSAARLGHPNVVTAYNALQLGDTLVFAMEYIEGEDLGQFVKTRGPLPVANACYYIQQAAQGLQHAWDRQMVHRDIKPQNLILSRQGRKHAVKILDFGLAKLVREKTPEPALTGAGKMMGTPDYIAPEQAQDAAQADIRADIYSLGCTFYYLLTGGPPFNGKSLYAILQAHQTELAKPVNAVRPDIPAGVAEVVARMMAKDPAARYQKPSELVQALAPFVKNGIKALATTPIMKSAPAIEQQTLVPAAINRETITDRPGTIVQFRHGGNRRTPVPRRMWILGMAGITSVTILLVLWAAGVFRVQTREGILVIQVNVPDAEVFVAGERAAVTWGNDRKRAEIGLQPGTYQVSVKKDGFTAVGETVMLEEGGQRLISAYLKKNRPAPITQNGTGDSIKKTDATPSKQNVQKEEVPEKAKDDPKQLVEAVVRNLRKLNPAFDGEVEHKIEDGAVSELILHTDDIIDLSPLRALPRLHSLVLRADKGQLSKLSDLSPLKGLPLRTLVCIANPVSDLSPLQGMPLEHFECNSCWQVTDLSPLKGLPLTYLMAWGWKGSDLTPLKGMRLTWLNCGGGGNVEDLSPLAGMPLEFLCINSSKVSDLSPLKGMPLKHLAIANTKVTNLTPIGELPITSFVGNFDANRDAVILRSLRTLEKINHIPVQEFWRDFDARTPAAQIKKLPGVVNKGNTAYPSKTPGGANNKSDSHTFASLFNGKDLSGWSTDAGHEDSWYVRDGVLTGKRTNGFSYLCTKRETFGYLHLRMEMRVEGLNSSINIPGYVVYIGGQSKDDNRTTGSIYGRSLHGDLLAAGPQTSVPTNDWFTLEILFTATEVRTVINGKTMSKYLRPAPDALSGALGIQCRGVSAVYFRKIEIKDPLRTAPPQQQITDLNQQKQGQRTQKSGASGDGAPESPEAAPGQTKKAKAAKLKGWVPLFNNKDFTAWNMPADRQDDWQVRNGILVWKSLENSVLQTTRDDFKDVYLRATVRISHGHYAQLFVRGGYRVILNCTNGNECKNGSLVIQGGGRIQVPKSFVQPGQWFTVEVLAKANRVTVAVNGQPTADLVDVNRHFLSGPIGILTLNQERDPQRYMEVSKIEIKELLADAPPRQVSGSSKHVLIGKLPPNFILSYTDRGFPVRPRDFKGKVLLLAFWAMPSEPSLPLFSHLRDWQQTHHVKGLEIWGLSTFSERFAYDEKANKVIQLAQRMSEAEEWEVLKHFAAHHELTNRLVMLPQKDWNAICGDYRVKSLPTAVLVDRKGIVRVVHVGFDENSAKVLEQELKEFLGN